MGNKQSPIPLDFPSTAHPAFRHAAINKKENKVELRVQMDPNYSCWKDSLNPLTPVGKYLLIPTAWRDETYDIEMCCTQSESEGLGYFIKAGYDPYIYTLENQIMTRKLTNRRFQEHQVWKLLKAGALALRDWETVYPKTAIGPIFPTNFVFDHSGHIKLVHRFSFPEETIKQIPSAYWPPENRPNQVIQYSMKSISGSHLYGLGLTILQALCLEQCLYSPVTTSQKKQFADESTFYSGMLKQTLLQMMEEDPRKRMQLHSVLSTIKIHQQQQSKN